VTIDPSPAKWWAYQWWGYHPDTDERILIDTVRRKMSTTDVLTMDLDTHIYSGLLVDTHKAAVEQGFPIDTVIVEKNAAQRFMLQNPIWTAWLQHTGVTLIPHETHSNKTSEYGVHTLQAPAKQGRLRLPGSIEEATRVPVERVIHELTHYPAAQDSDQVMAAWFFEHHLAKSWTPKKRHYQFSRPGYFKDVERGMASRREQPKPRLRFRVGADAVR
jgi:hypothetical protein